MSTLLPLTCLSLAFGLVHRVTLHEDGVTPESDTTHTTMLVLLALDIAGRHPELGLDLGRLAILGTVHDLPEAHAGDTNTAGGLSPEAKAAKEAREAAALDRIRAEVGGPVTDWIECYERQDTPEARFLRYLDKILPKLTHALNGCAAIRKMGRDVAWLRAHHERQGAELAARYPEFAGVLGPLFEEAARGSEEALAKTPSTPTNCDHCRHDLDGGGYRLCRIALGEVDGPDIEVEDWIAINVDETKNAAPKPCATGCPGFAPKES